MFYFQPNIIYLYRALFHLYNCGCCFFAIDSRRTVVSSDRWLKINISHNRPQKNIGSCAHRQRLLIRIPETKIKTKTSVVYKQRAKSEVLSYEKFLLWPMTILLLVRRIYFQIIRSAEYITNAVNKPYALTLRPDYSFQRGIERMNQHIEKHVSSRKISHFLVSFSLFSVKYRRD